MFSHWTQSLQQNVSGKLITQTAVYNLLNTAYSDSQDLQKKTVEHWENKVITQCSLCCALSTDAKKKKKPNAPAQRKCLAPPLSSKLIKITPERH